MNVQYHAMWLFTTSCRCLVQIQVLIVYHVSLLKTGTKNNSSNLQPGVWATTWFFKNKEEINIYPTLTTTTPVKQSIRDHLLFHQADETDKCVIPYWAHILNSVLFHFAYFGELGMKKRQHGSFFLSEEINKISPSVFQSPIFCCRVHP